MEFKDFHKKIRSILSQDLPPGNRAVAEGRALAKGARIGRTLFLEKHGVASEADYKKICIREKRITFHAHIGLNTWDATARAMERLYREGRDLGVVVDRAGICLDRRMGLPRAAWESVPAETGPMLASAKDWMETGSCAPIQPHMGDFIIGFPAGVENTLEALAAGCTTIGNLSQFFSHEVPGWKDHVFTTDRTVTAISLLGALRDQGTLVHSYLEDGYGALFYDCATIAGWAFLEKHLVQELLGARLSHCIGGLTTDPVKRAGWVFALDEIHDHQCLGSMIYGDTLSFTRNPDANAGLVSEYLLWDILAQMACPTGHAILPLPFTEGVRIPSVDEILQAQTLGTRVLATAQRLFDHVDLSQARAFARKVVAGGRQVFANAMDGLAQAGVNTNDPVQMLYVLKKMGPALFEEMFSAGRADPCRIRCRIPLVPTDVFEMSQESLRRHTALFQTPAHRKKLAGQTLAIASTDVHEHAILILEQLCREAGAKTVYLGAEKNPDEVVTLAARHGADSILLSTHNGMALDYARHLKARMGARGLDLPVLFGGILNQKMPDAELPLDVAGQINALGFLTADRLKPNLIEQLGSRD